MKLKWSKFIGKSNCAEERHEEEEEEEKATYRRIAHKNFRTTATVYAADDRAAKTKNVPEVSVNRVHNRNHNENKMYYLIMLINFTICTIHNMKKKNC